MSEDLCGNPGCRHPRLNHTRHGFVIGGICAVGRCLCIVFVESDDGQLSLTEKHRPRKLQIVPTTPRQEDEETMTRKAKFVKMSDAEDERIKKAAEILARQRGLDKMTDSDFMREASLGKAKELIDAEARDGESAIQ